MEKRTITTAYGAAQGYVISLEKVQVVFAKTRSSLLACGAFNVEALAAFDCPAARVKGKGAKSIATIEDLLDGEVVEVNSHAAHVGISIGASGREALDGFLSAEKE